MNDGLKQRIVGALVLVALGIIFIPVIFDKERIVPVDRVSQIPLEPDLRAVPLPEAAVPPRALDERLVEPIKGDFQIEEAVNVTASDLSKGNPSKGEVETTQGSETEVVETEITKVQSSVDDVPASDLSERERPKVRTATPESIPEVKTLKSEMWVLQVASYVDLKQAEHTLKELESSGYRAFIKSVQTSAGARTRLYLGPSIDKPSLEKAKKVVDKKYAVDTLLLRFTP